MRFAGDTLIWTAINDLGVGRVKLTRITYSSQDSIHYYRDQNLVAFELMQWKPRPNSDLVDLETRVINNTPYSYKDLKVSVELFGDSGYFVAAANFHIARYPMSIDILLGNSSITSQMTIRLPDYKIVGGPAYVILGQD